MSRATLLSGFVTPTINGETESRRGPVNESAIYAPVNEQTRDDSSEYTLVDHYGGANKTARQEGYKIINMVLESGETTHLLCGKSMYEAVQLEGIKEKDEESLNNNFTHYAIDPMCMNVRLCIFWLLWATLIVVLVVCILHHCCFPAKLNHYLGQTVSANRTHV